MKKLRLLNLVAVIFGAFAAGFSAASGRNDLALINFTALSLNCFWVLRID